MSTPASRTASTYLPSTPRTPTRAAGPGAHGDAPKGHHGPEAAPRTDGTADQRPVAGHRQLSFDELGTPLHDVTFCVVDLETTGSSPADAGITEVGAVKVRGGELLGEFQTLVNPERQVPGFITVLTGITEDMVSDAPSIGSVLPAFLAFAEGSVLVAHNAPFDVGFLKQATASNGTPWPSFAVVDTARLARQVLTRDETPNCKLETLARLFRSAVTPDHRALTDARATVDVLHALVGRLGNLGVHTLEELSAYSSRVSPAQRRKRHLADKLPHGPGVYMFADSADRVLYVGTSNDLRTRVRSYFTASETRSRIGEMIGLATDVRAIECATPLEASVRELRLIAALEPRYNKRSKFPERATWVKVTVEPYPRLSMVRTVRPDGACYLGPFGSRKVAEQAVAAIHEAIPIRQCTDAFGATPRNRSACVLWEMSRCLGPCIGAVDVSAYATQVAAVRDSIELDPSPVVDAAISRIRTLTFDERYEEATIHRDRMAAFVRASARVQRVSALADCSELVAARRADDGGWVVHVVRYGRLAGAGVVQPGVPARPAIDIIVAGSETVTAPNPPEPAATVSETEQVLTWLEQPGVRLVEISGEWSCPTSGAGSLTEWLNRAYRGTEPIREPHRR